MEYAMFLIQTKSVQCFSAEAVSSPMLFGDERFLQFKEEIKDACLHFSNLFIILPIVFFSSRAFLTHATSDVV